MSKIEIRLLYKKLGFSNKLPKDYETRIENFEFPGYKWMGRLQEVTVVKATLIVKRSPDKSHKSSEHRIFVVCPQCGREIPFGRWHQHAGTATCLRKKVFKVELTVFCEKKDADAIKKSLSAWWENQTVKGRMEISSEQADPLDQDWYLRNCPKELPS